MKKTIAEITERLSKKLPKFTDGRINYSNSRVAPVIIIFVMVGEELLILKRSQKVIAYKGEWSGSAGFLDDLKPIEKKALEELTDELGIEEKELKKLIVEIKVCDYYGFKDKKTKRIWIKTPVLVKLAKKPEITLNWEHDDFDWIKKEQLSQFDTVVDLENALERALN